MHGVAHNRLFKGFSTLTNPPALICNRARVTNRFTIKLAAITSGGRCPASPNPHGCDSERNSRAQPKRSDRLAREKVLHGGALCNQWMRLFFTSFLSLSKSACLRISPSYSKLFRIDARICCG